MDHLKYDLQESDQWLLCCCLHRYQWKPHVFCCLTNDMGLQSTVQYCIAYGTHHVKRAEHREYCSNSCIESHPFDRGHHMKAHEMSCNSNDHVSYLHTLYRSLRTRRSQLSVPNFGNRSPLASSPLCLCNRN